MQIRSTNQHSSTVSVVLFNGNILLFRDIYIVLNLRLQIGHKVKVELKSDESALICAFSEFLFIPYALAARPLTFAVV